MRRLLVWTFAVVCLFVTVNELFAASAVVVLGKDYAFPNRIDGLPSKLSDFQDLQINSFETSDGVKLAYWEAGTGKPLIFVPAWSANGANYINVLYLLSKHYHVYVLDERNQGLSQKVDFGNRIYRYAMDLREFNEHIGVKSAYYCGWSMGVSILYGYIDLFGTTGIEKLVLIDEPPSILSRPGMTADERLKSGAIADSVQQVGEVMSARKGMSLMERYNAMDSPPYANSEAFAREMVPVDTVSVNRIMYDHASIDWRDVISTKINVPTAIFTGDYSANVPSQRWMQSVIPNSTLYVYSKTEQGDHFLVFKNPVKFTRDLEEFLRGKDVNSPAATGESNVIKETLLAADASWNGAPYEAYPGGKPELTVLRITIPAHGDLPWHSHPMPNAAYVVSGEITVEDKSGMKKHFSAGQVIPETVNTLHRGITGDTAAVLIVFYAGTRGMPLSQMGQ